MNINDSKLSKLHTEVKYAKGDRRWSRFGRNGETSGSYTGEACRAFHKAHRKAAKLALKAHY
tara:strand:- start:259 stop:444 length:186 start_codon:yes stop_codon:yes gene_type:complete